MNSLMPTPKWLRDEMMAVLVATKEGIHNVMRHSSGRRLTDKEIAEIASMFCDARAENEDTDE